MSGVSVSSGGNSVPLNIVTLTASDPKGVEDWAKLVADWVSKNALLLKDVAFTANTGSQAGSHRAAIVASDAADLVKQLRRKLDIQGQSSGGRPKLCFLFTGQGSQFHKMGQTLYEISPVFQEAFDNCDTVLQELNGVKLKEILWTENEQPELHQTLYSQTAIFCIEYCFLKLWESLGILPDIVVGHSLGEYGAATAAGILSFRGALKLVGERSRLIDNLPRGKMLVVRANQKETGDLLRKAGQQKSFWLDYAAINSPEQTVLAGTAEAVTFFADFCVKNSILVHVLDATHAFHSRMMEPMLEEFRQVAQSVTYSAPTCDFVSGLNGKLTSSVDAEYWITHAREGVQFLGASQAVYNQGGRVCIEVGPQPHLSAMLNRNVKELPKPDKVTCFPSMKKVGNQWTTFVNTLAKVYSLGYDVDWSKFHKISEGNKVTLPPYPA